MFGRANYSEGFLKSEIWWANFWKCLYSKLYGSFLVNNNLSFFWMWIYEDHIYFLLLFSHRGNRNGILRMKQGNSTERGNHMSDGKWKSLSLLWVSSQSTLPYVCVINGTDHKAVSRKKVWKIQDLIYGFDNARRCTVYNPECT